MSLIGFLIFGFFVGLLARAVMPGTQKMGIIMTTILGAVGSFLGGVLGTLLAGARLGDAHAAGWIGSILGAVIILGVTGFRRRGLFT